jgi:hypothetical protein
VRWNEWKVALLYDRFTTAVLHWIDNMQSPQCLLPQFNWCSLHFTEGYED